LKQIYTKTLKLKNLSDTVIKKISLEPIGRLVFELKKVKVIIPVDEFTEASYDIPIEFKGVPDSLKVKTFPKSVRVKYIISLSHFNEVTPDSLHVYIDYQAIDPGLSSKLKVELDSVPYFLHKVSVTPRTVEFLIERKNAEDWIDRRNR
jgi:YbbR domain-containing protein